MLFGLKQTTCFPLCLTLPHLESLKEPVNSRKCLLQKGRVHMHQYTHEYMHQIRPLIHLLPTCLLIHQPTTHPSMQLSIFPPTYVSIHSHHAYKPTHIQPRTCTCVHPSTHQIIHPSKNGCCLPVHLAQPSDAQNLRTPSKTAQILCFSLL
jgi:hypothetical protein